MAEKQNLILDRQGAVCTVIINNPEKRNALSPGCLYEIKETFSRLQEDGAMKVAVLRGAGREAFSAGADISAMPTRESGQPKTAGVPAGSIDDATAAIQNYPYPVIAMLHGYTLGAGCMLAMACDIRVASNSVKMGIPTSRIGLIPSYEAFKRFLVVLGYGTTLEIFLSGRQYHGEACSSKGMINHLVEDDALEEFTYGLAEEIAGCAPLSLRGAKHILTRMAENPNPSLEELSAFRALREQARRSDDHEEAKLAFKERRKPVFKGR